MFTLFNSTAASDAPDVKLGPVLKQQLDAEEKHYNALKQQADDLRKELKELEDRITKDRRDEKIHDEKLQKKAASDLYDTFDQDLDPTNSGQIYFDDRIKEQYLVFFASFFAVEKKIYLSDYYNSLKSRYPYIKNIKAEQTFPQKQKALIPIAKEIDELAEKRQKHYEKLKELANFEAINLAINIYLAHLEKEPQKAKEVSKEFPHPFSKLTQVKWIADKIQQIDRCSLSPRQRIQQLRQQVEVLAEDISKKRRWYDPRKSEGEKFLSEINKILETADSIILTVDLEKEIAVPKKPRIAAFQIGGS